MKLKVVHTYQTVRFNKHDETHFTAAKPNMAEISMEYLPELLAVRIDKPGAESVLVFATNIAYAVPADEPKKSK